jgi:hypothetical protein
MKVLTTFVLLAVATLVSAKDKDSKKPSPCNNCPTEHDQLCAIMPSGEHTVIQCIDRCWTIIHVPC